MKNDNRLYSLVFPVWAVLIFPWSWFVVLPLNFAIDSLAIILMYKIFKFDNIKHLYLRTVFKVWIFGILASLVGFVFMWLSFPISALFQNPAFMSSVCESVTLNPFSNIVGFLWVAVAIALSGFVGYFLNMRLTFNITGFPKRYRHRVAVAVAFMTAPYTFLIPTVWFK